LTPQPRPSRKDVAYGIPGPIPEGHAQGFSYAVGVPEYPLLQDRDDLHVLAIVGRKPPARVDAILIEHAQ